LPFTQSKFLTLKPQRQAKKLADCIRQLLLLTPTNYQELVQEYNTMCAWYFGAQAALIQAAEHATDQADQADQLSIKPDGMRQDALIHKYTYWRQKTGLGVEQDITRYAYTDREQPAATTIPWSVLAHNLRSGYNVGSVIRTCDCFGFKTVHISGYSAPPTHKSVQGAAMGSQEWVQHQQWRCPLECIAHAKANSLTVVALETSPTGLDCFSYKWPASGLLIVGNEELGIAPEILELCDEIVQIPMYGRKTSLNVASAFAIAAAQIRHNVPV
jgi:tRNA G18 (ribose-2'-O)-methylase SpoU